jgi:hypothetical protein
VDHQRPDYSKDGSMIVYNGEMTPDCGSSCRPYCYDGHPGIDYSVAYVPVFAAAGGVIIQREYIGGYGETVKISHGNGWETWYAHLSAYEPGIVVGMQVTRGQKIATSGNTGQSSGPHLHFEVRYNGQPTDPFGRAGSGIDPLYYSMGRAATCLWTDGQCGHVVVDENTGRFQTNFGGGNTHCTGYSYSMFYVPNRQSSVQYWGYWNPGLRHSGPYAVYAHIPSVNATTGNAGYRIHHTSGISVSWRSQAAYYNEWIYLGSFEFAAGTGHWVRLEDLTYEDQATKVGFDAIRFVQHRIYVPFVARNTLN